MIANSDQKCKLISINKEFVFKSQKLDIQIKCADDLIVKNSDIP